jgi:hypothetical protein
MLVFVVHDVQLIVISSHFLVVLVDEHETRSAALLNFFPFLLRLFL